MKRFLLIVLAWLMMLSCCVTLLACQKPSQPQQPQEDLNSPEDLPEPEAPAVTWIDIIKDGKTEFRIVRSDLATGEDPRRVAAAQLRAAINSATGCNMDITTDWTSDENGAISEIVVGQCDRAVCELTPTDLARDEFIIRFEGNKILIDGGSDAALTAAVNYFLETYLGYDQSTGACAKTELSIPDQLNLRQTFPYPMEVYLIWDIKGISGSGNSEHYNDVVRFYTSLQGRLNKRAEETRFYIYQMYDKTDQFWLDYISSDGKMLDGCERIDLKSWQALWDAFAPYIQEAGMVVWDPDAPATANVAATICSVEGYLPVRYDTSNDSLYTWLYNHGVDVKMNLCDMFTGKLGTMIADTDIPSTGSIKCDPYLWAMEKYMDRTNPGMLAYALDGASQVATNEIYKKAESTSPAYNQLYSHDYYIYN